MRQALTLIVWLLLAGGLGPAAAEERLVAFWMTSDAGPKLDTWWFLGQQASADRQRIKAAQDATQALGAEVLFFDSIAQRGGLEEAFTAMRAVGIRGV